MARRWVQTKRERERRQRGFAITERPAETLLESRAHGTTLVPGIGLNVPAFSETRWFASGYQPVGRGLAR